MSHSVGTPATDFIDRRNLKAMPVQSERRQFGNNYDSLTHEARELATAIDQYKVRHRRRFITYEEMLDVIQSLGYSKS